MGRISIELVPRSVESFNEELKEVKDKFPRIDTINIPDILKFDMRIPEACEVAHPYFSHVIPHIRAVAVHKEEPLPFKELFREQGIDEVLVILGDNPEIISKSECPCDSIDLIKKIKLEMPEVKVYAGVDQWRTTLEEEIDYVHKKINAGADGFFSQPFFDLQLLETYAKKLAHVEVFWGLAPVVRESSKEYWETKNKVIFPEDFMWTLEWNKKFAHEVLKFADEDKSHVYFCPITVDFVAYLTGIV